MKDKEAMSLLGLTTSPKDDAEIKAAFSAAAKRSHPDSPEYDNHAATMDQLISARRHLLSSKTTPVISCQVCGGRGIVVLGFCNTTCTSCGGTGERK